MNNSFIPPAAASTAASTAGLRSRFFTSGEFSGITRKASFRRPLLLAVSVLGLLANRASALNSTNVATGAAFHTALGAGDGKIVLTADITLAQSEIVNKGQIVVFDHFLINKGSASTLTFNGEAQAGRQQIFSGWSAGNITGHFSTGVVYPEWWGLTTNQNDIAINCAVKSFGNGSGVVVSLGGGDYPVSAPIDMSQSISRLEGAGDGRTRIIATDGWSDPAPVNCPVWGSGNNHSALIWIGTDTAGAQSFRTGVRGVAVHCMEAARAHPEIRISGISSKATVEENSLIENVAVGYYSGFGIGFAGTGGGLATINGLNIRGFWISGALRRDSFPIFFTQHANVASVESGTVDASVSRAGSELFDAILPAKSTLTFTGNPADGDTVTIGSKTYRFKDTMSAVNDVQRDKNLAGVAFSNDMTPLNSMSSTVATSNVFLTAVDTGARGNLAVSTNDANLRFTGSLASTTLLGGNATTKASTILTFNNNPSIGSTVTLGTHAYSFVSGFTPTGTPFVTPWPPTETVETLVSRTYTFVNTLTGANQVKIGITPQVTAANFKAALDGAAHLSLLNLANAVNAPASQSGIAFFTGTTANTAATASVQTATQVIGSHGNPALSDTVTLSSFAGSRVYTFVSGASSGLNVHRVDHSAEFATGMTPHPEVTASEAGGIVTVTSTFRGLNGHYPLATAGSSNLTLSGANLTGGVSGGSPPKTPLHATGTVTFSGSVLPANNSTLSVGSKTYTFVTTLTGVDGQVQIDSTGVNTAAKIVNTRANLVAAFRGAAFDSLDSLVTAINNDTSSPMKAGPVKHDSFTLTSRIDAGTFVAGNNANGITVSVSGSFLAAGGDTAERGLPLTTLQAVGVAGSFAAFTTTKSSSVLSWNTQLAGENALSNPDYLTHWPAIAIHAAGAHTKINSVHIEGAGIGIQVPQQSAINGVTISNVDTWYMMSEGMSFIGEALHEPPFSLRREAATWPHPNASVELNYWKYATTVLISMDGPLNFQSGRNGKDRVVINTICSNGETRYLLRDGMMGIEHSAFGHGQFPESSASGISFYARGDAFGPPSGFWPNISTGRVYNNFGKLAPVQPPNNFKQYFIGPIE